MNSTRDLILGHMPFIGISYQNSQKDEEYRKRFSKISEIEKVIKAAVKLGLRKFAAATPDSSPLSPIHLQALQLTISEGHSLEIFPCVGIPLCLGTKKIDPFRRWATYLDIESQLYQETKTLIIEDPILNFREDWKNRLIASKPYSEEDFRELVIDWERINKNLQFFTEFPTSHIEFGSEIDFLAMTERFDLIGELVERAKAYGFKKVLLGVHHAGMTIPLLKDRLQDFEGYVTPLNPLGVMMFPTKQSAEKAVNTVKKSVYAIKPLAGGRVKPRRAFKYLLKHPIDGCMIGVSSIPELKENLKAAELTFRKGTPA